VFELVSVDTRNLIRTVDVLAVVKHLSVNEAGVIFTASENVNFTVVSGKTLTGP
jgi:hypothetical protein